MTAKNDDYYHLGLTDSEVLQSREKNGVKWEIYLVAIGHNIRK